MAWETLQGLLRNSLKGFLALPETGGDVPIVDAVTGKKQLTAVDLLDTAVLPAGYQLPLAIVPNLAGLEYTRFVESQPSGTGGGALTAGSWETRLNSHIGGSLAGCSIDGAGAMTVPSGTYLALGRAASYRCGNHQTWLKSAGLEVSVLGGSAYAGAGDDTQTDSFLIGFFTMPATPVTFKLTHRCAVTHIFGRGNDASFDAGNIFADLLLIKLPDPA